VAHVAVRLVASCGACPCSIRLIGSLVSYRVVLYCIIELLHQPSVVTPRTRLFASGDMSVLKLTQDKSRAPNSLLSGEDTM
jgi:hypothetical protein